MNSSWYIAIQKEVINIVVAIVTHMTKPINGCTNTKVCEVVGSESVTEILKS